MRRRVALAAACLAWPGAARAWEGPVVRAQLLGGQYFFAGEKGALGGNASMSVVPAARVNDAWTVVPVLSSSYEGTKQSVELVGGGTLFQERMEHRAAVRAIYAPSAGRWRVKPSVGYTYTLLNETRDEQWGRGLFDSWRLGAGVEAEYVHREPYSLRAGVDYHFTAFPNYVSLESRAGFDPTGAPLARELAGRRTLDHHAQSAHAAGSLARGRFLLEARLREQRSSFPDQRLVDGSGALGRVAREDFLTSFSLAARMPPEANTDRRLLGSLDLGLSVNASNQSSYDARRARYLPGFYDFVEFRSGLGAQWLLGDPRRPVVASGGLGWARRAYPHRPAQDPTGVYLSSSLRQDLWSASLGLNVPLAPSFSAVGRWEHAWGRSNQGFQQVYTYDYTASNYLFGVSYEY
ncbi:MAG: hypothetical protein HY553_12490 [Elusimicrobia bacterium]|nr:hypothetical protein [Elusimicrobiota bacterium]